MSARLVVQLIGKWAARIVLFLFLTFLATSSAEAIHLMSFGSKYAAEGQFTGFPFPYACNGGLDGICGSGFINHEAYYQDIVFWGLIVSALMVMIERRFISTSKSTSKYRWLKVHGSMFAISFALYIILFFSILSFEGG